MVAYFQKYSREIFGSTRWLSLAAEEGQPWPPSECLMCLRPLITHKQDPLVQLYIMKLWIVMIPSLIHTKSIE